MNNGLPYGWDYSVDPVTKKYYINHVGDFFVGTHLLNKDYIKVILINGKY